MQTGDCMICGEGRALGWARCCDDCWDAMPPTDDYAHDWWCANGACPHGFGPIHLPEHSDGTSDG